MYYYYFQLADDQKQLRELKETLPHKIKAAALRLQSVDKSDQEATEKAKADLVSLRAQATNDVMNAICGDKEILNVLLSTSPLIKSAQDTVKFSRVDQIIRKLDDPEWAVFDDDLYSWIVSMISHDGYNLVVKDPSGNDVQFFPAGLKLAIGRFLAGFLAAQTNMPEDFRLRLVKKESPSEEKTKNE